MPSANSSALRAFLWRLNDDNAQIMSTQLEPILSNAAQLVGANSLDSEMYQFLSILQQLVREPSVVGTEDSFFRVIRRELEELGLRVEYFQGTLVAQGNQPNHLVLSAHIDRHGLLCTGPNEFQYAAFIAANRSEQTGESVSEQMLESIQHRFRGQRVQAHLPYSGTYLGQGRIINSFICPSRNNLIFELDGLAFLPPGTPVSYLDRLRITDNYIAAQLDNVLSVALLIFMFHCGFQGTALFTAQEEAGRSWRYALAWFQRQRLATQRLLVLDTSPFPTRESADQQQLVLRRKDANGHFAVGLSEDLLQRCQDLRIDTIYKDAYVEAQNVGREKPLSLGRTELGRLVAATNGQINGTTLQIPTTGYHTADEQANLASVSAAIAVLKSFI